MNFVVLRFGSLLSTQRINQTYFNIELFLWYSESRLEELKKQIVIVLKRLEVIKLFLVDKESDCFAEIIKIEER